MKRLLLTLLSFLLISGCGYRLSNEALQLPDDTSILALEMFENRTLEPYLENILTTFVTRRLLLLPDITLIENPEDAEAVVSGRIIMYHVESSAYDGQNIVTQYRATMVVEAEFRRQEDGKIFWRGELIRFQTFPADTDLKRQDDLERIAQDILSTRLAEELSARLTETF